MAAYAALTSLLQILDQLEHHPFPPISLDRQQVESLTEIATFLQEFLEGYDSPFVDSDEADPLEMRIADAAYEAEDVIESYIVDNIHFAAAATHDDKVINSEQGINPNEETARLDDEVNSSSGEETNNQKKKICRFFNCFRGSKKPKKGGKKNKIQFAAAATHDDEVISSSRKKLNSEKEANSNEDASCSGLAGEAINISGEEISCVNFYQDVWKVIEEMDLVKKEAMEMMREKSDVQAHHRLQRNILTPSSFSGKKSSMMVGFEVLRRQLLEKLVGGPSSLQVIPITGMGGIGKTTLARNIFDNACIKEHFDICAWVTISQQYNTKEILSQILYQASGKSSEKNVQELGNELHKYLYGRRYLIIMDDMWSIEVWEEMSLYFPNCENGSRTIVTTRQSFLTSQLTDSNDVFHMKFLDEVNSWNLFTKTFFGGEGFPLQLEIIGKRILKKCKGLPLSIIVIGGLLANSEHILEHWEHIEHKLNSIVNSENDEYCLKILKLSYNHLPAYLKPSFLYMGILEEDKKIHVSTLIKLWVSEGFLKPENGKSLETIGEGFLKDLIDRNLILVDELGKTGNIKYCKMHDLLRDLCLKEAEKERFYHVMRQHGPRDRPRVIKNHKRRRIDFDLKEAEKERFYRMIGQHGPRGSRRGSRRGIQNHKRRRMVFDQRISEERVRDTLESTWSHVRSLIDRSDYDRVGLLTSFRLLRILKADERLPFKDHYRFEDVIYKLVNCRYVAIWSESRKSINIPSSVNFLWNLSTLRIVCDSPMGLIIAPVEIWKMSQLKYVHVDVKFHSGGLYLPDPPSGSSIVILKNLQTLKGILNFKCGKEMVKRIPNIKKLQIEYKEIRRHDGDYYCLRNLHSLRKLESLTIKLVHGKDDDFLHNIIFPQSLIKLSLELKHSTGLGWEEMLEKIGDSLPLLQKLRLKNGVFKTGKWETVEGQFPSLKFLELFWCSGLKQWMIEESSHFPFLEHLCLSGLEELEEIPLEIGEIPTLQTIELRYCSESAVKSAKKIVEEQKELQGGEQLPFLVRVVEYRKKQEELQSLASSNFQFQMRRSTSSIDFKAATKKRKVMMMV